MMKEKELERLNLLKSTEEYLYQKGFEQIYIYTPHPNMQTLFQQLDFQIVEKEIRACTANFWKTKLDIHAEGIWFICG